jgi:hypothetical protein
MKHTLCIENTLSFSIPASGQPGMLAPCVHLLPLNLGPTVFLINGSWNSLQIPEKVGVPLIALTEILQCACLSLARVQISLVSRSVSGDKAVVWMVLEVFHGLCCTITAFWNAMPCSLVVVWIFLEKDESVNTYFGGCEGRFVVVMSMLMKTEVCLMLRYTDWEIVKTFRRRILPPSSG